MAITRNQTVPISVSPPIVPAHHKEKITEIGPSRGLRVLNLGELWSYRDLLLTFAQRDLTLRYRQTAVGVLWVVIQPILTSLIFTLVFGVLARLPSEGVPYFVLAMAGSIGFNAFSSTLTKANTSLVQNANLVSKIYFPRLILPLSTVFSSLVDFGVSLVVMAILMICYHVVPTIALLLLPVWLILALMMAIGVGLYTAGVTVRYRDVQYVTPVVVQLLTYATPVGYSIAKPPHGLPHAAQLFWSLNPLTPLMEGMRWSLLGTNTPPSGLSVLYAVIVAVVFFFGGALAFYQMERKFADVI